MSNLKNLNESLSLSSHVSLNIKIKNLEEENTNLKNRILADKKKFNNFKRNKLRLKKLLNNKISEKDEEIKRLVNDHNKKIDEKPPSWEWETIDNVEYKSESDR